MAMQAVKCVAVGDKEVGKTCLVIAFSCKAYPSEYIPTMFDNYSASVVVDGSMVNMGLWDTSGSDVFQRLRPLSYPNTDVFLLCFSLTCPESLENIRTKWYPEVQRFCPGVPVIVVGTKADMRDNKEGVQCLHTDKAETLAKDIGAAVYMETSSLRMEGLDTLFTEVARTGLVALTTAREKGLRNDKIEEESEDENVPDDDDDTTEDEDESGEVEKEGRIEEEKADEENASGQERTEGKGQDKKETEEILGELTENEEKKQSRNEKKEGSKGKEIEENRKGEDETEQENNGEVQTGDEKTGEEKQKDEKTGEEKQKDEKTGEEKQKDEKTGEEKQKEEKTGEEKQKEEKRGEDKTGEE